MYINDSILDTHNLTYRLQIRGVPIIILLQFDRSLGPGKFFKSKVNVFTSAKNNIMYVIHSDQ